MKGVSMSKTSAYFTILLAGLLTAAAGYILHIKIIQSLCAACLVYIQNPILPVTAAVCGFLFYGSKNYWLIITGCAIITAVILQYAIVGQGTTMLLFISRVLTFMIVVFLMNLLKLLVNRG